MGRVTVYGIGNPLTDVLADVEDAELWELSLQKGTMALIDDETGETILRFLGDREKTYLSGGSCPNTINTLAALGVEATLSGCVGTDELGGIYTERLREDGVISDISAVDGATGTSIVLVTPDAERTMNTRLGACRRYAPENVNHRVVADAEILYFTGYMWDTEPQKAAITAAMDTARRQNTTIVFDVADPMAVDRYREDFLHLIRQDADVILANRREARMLLKDDEITAEDAAREFSRWCSLAAVKDGVRGSVLAVENEVFSIPAVPTETVDTTGAGDNYAAGLIFGLLRGEAPDVAGRRASMVASGIVAQRGAQFRDRTRQQLHDAIHEPIQETTAV